MPFDRVCSYTRRASVACVLLGIVVAATSEAGATPLGLSSTHPGDVTTHYMYVHYDPSDATFHAEGYPDQFDVHNQNIQFDGNNYFSLTMVVNPSTGALVSGAVSISGDTDGSPSYSGLLLQGTITEFGFPDPGPNFGGGNIFEFVVHVTGGALLAPYYSGADNPAHSAGIIMNIANGSSSPSFTAANLFTAAFQNDGFSGLGGSADTFPTPSHGVPEPGTIILLGIGFLPLAWRLRRRGVHPI